jgi:type IV secretion system protein VirB10
MKNSNLNANISPTGLDDTVHTGVKKLNKVPIIIISTILVIILLGLGYATVKRSEQTQNKKNKQGKIRNDGESMANDFISKLYQSRTQPTDKKELIVKKEPTLNIKKESLKKESNPLDSSSADQVYKKRLLEEKLALEKYKRELYKTALSAPTKVALKSFTSKSMSRGVGLQQRNNPIPPNPPDIYSQIAKAYKGANDSSKQSNLNKNEMFLNTQQQSNTYLNAKKMKPVSPYEMKTGTLIPSVLITEINSDLPGPIKAQVSENVFDTATGNHLLIPQGSTLIGVYSSNVQYGQNRVLIAFNRIIFPDGQTLNIGAMNGINQEGAAGFNDQVNNHYVKIFGSALLMGAITGGIASADTTQQNQYIESNRQKMIGALISELGQVARQMIQKNMNIAPTIEIRAGYKFNIFTTKDIILEPLEY